MVLNLRPKCANPSCAASFEWLAGGRMFRIPRTTPESESGSNRAEPVAHYWLCEHCSNLYILQFEPGRGVTIRPLWPALPAAREDMHLSASQTG